MPKRAAWIVSGLLAAGLAACSPAVEAPDPQPSAMPEPQAVPEAIARAETAAMTLGKELKSVLVATMQEEGPVAAISVCNEQAPQIASAIAANQNLKVGRTSLKVRNPGNAPDDWERLKLEDFQARLDAGETAEGMSASALATVDGETHLRWMAPIMTADVCTVCHGGELAPQIASAIADKYPDDAATGFEPGDMRGAFTVSVPLGR